MPHVGSLRTATQDHLGLPEAQLPCDKPATQLLSVAVYELAGDHGDGTEAFCKLAAPTMV